MHEEKRFDDFCRISDSADSRGKWSAVRRSPLAATCRVSALRDILPFWMSSPPLALSNCTLLGVAGSFAEYVNDRWNRVEAVKKSAI
ncbi:hypothetical protein Moror_2562 [Moniliophthora roreri MCA 2997]|uniref:Uncharacterized protein n=1 Tax=Moniliophthora roreri (strain MCA 2997) TaxID=1381753 RepID=V2XCX8_MONRO|nr:hypothetical protein Moror_2562 [Moniliophthora roreri MCA 2997]